MYLKWSNHLPMTAQRKDTFLHIRKQYCVSSSTGNDLLHTKINFPAFASDCWKGYVASWKVKRNCLYLTDITYTAFGDVGVSFIFPGKTEVWASWLSGTFILQGAAARNEPPPPGYDLQTMLTFVQGKLIWSEVVTIRRSEPLAMVFAGVEAGDL